MVFGLFYKHILAIFCVHPSLLSRAFIPKVVLRFFVASEGRIEQRVGDNKATAGWTTAAAIVAEEKQLWCFRWVNDKWLWQRAIFLYEYYYYATTLDALCIKKALYNSAQTFVCSLRSFLLSTTTSLWLRGNTSPVTAVLLLNTQHNERIISFFWA